MGLGYADLQANEMVPSQLDIMQQLFPWYLNTCSNELASFFRVISGRDVRGWGVGHLYEIGLSYFQLSQASEQMQVCFV